MSDVIQVRASSWSDLFDCAMRWEARNILGITMPTNGKAWTGTSLHASTAVYDSARLEGNPVSVEDAESVLVDCLHHPNDDVDWEDSSPHKIEPIARKLHERYCNEIAPTRDYSGVEVQCEALNIDTGEGVTIQLTGTTDRIRAVNDGHGISDIKSGKMAVGTDNKAKVGAFSSQLGVYEIMAEFASGVKINQPAEIVGLQTNGKARVGTATIVAPRSVLLGDDNTPGLIEYAAKMFKAGIFPPNPRSMLCGNKYCPIYTNCQYHD